MILRAMVVVASLIFINVDFHTSWRESSDLRVLSAGLSPLDPNLTSIVSSVETPFTPYVLFWDYYSEVLSNSLYSAVIPPLFCPADETTSISIFYPGGFSSIYPSPPTLRNLTNSGLVVYDAPGYQVEYCAPSGRTSHFSAHNCRVYSTNSLGVGLCVQREGNYVVAGSHSVQPSLIRQA
jgi:hypothetical protein